MKKQILIFSLFSLFIQLNTSQAQNLQNLYQAGMSAYEVKDYALFKEKMRAALALRPQHPTLLYNLAAAEALLGEKEISLNHLEELIWLHAGLPFANDTDFGNLKEESAFLELVERAKTLQQEIRNSVLALEVQDNTLHPEGIAYHPASGNWYVSSIRQRKIVRITEKGNMEDFASGNELWGIMGMAIDPKRELLWACSTALPEMQGHSEELKDRAAVLCFELASGELKGRFEARDPGIFLGDLTIGPNGTVYASSSSVEFPALYRVNENAGTLDRVQHFPELASLQGLCFGKSNQVIFLADYRFGIGVYHLEKHSFQLLQNLTEHPLKGIDGLYYTNGALIGIHNGLTPYRVVCYQLNRAEDQLTHFAFLDKALPEMNEPTLGWTSHGEFFYLANSPWGAYNQEKVFQPEKASNPIILKVAIEQPFQH